MTTATLSAGVILDATRTAALDGDGLAAESSAGIWPAATNDLTNGDFHSGVTGYTTTSGAQSAVTTPLKFGTHSGKFVASGGTMAILADTAVVSAGAGLAAAGVRGASVWIYVDAGNGAIGKNAQLILNARDGVHTPETVAQYSDPTNGTAGKTLVAGWQRLTAAGTMVGVAWTSLRLQVNLGSATSGNTIYLSGVQIERSTLATPFTVTSRGDGRTQLPTLGLSGVTGWIAVRVRPSWASLTPPSASVVLARWTGATADDRLELAYEITSIVLRRRNAGGVTEITRATIFADSTSLTIIGRWTPTRLSVSVNGSAFANGTDAEFADDFERPDQLELGTASTGQVWIEQGAGDAQIVSGRYVAGADPSRLYREIDLTAPAVVKRASFSFSGTTGIQPAIVMIESPDGVQNGTGNAYVTMLHPVVGLGAYTVEVYDAGSPTTLFSGNWPNVSGATEFNAGAGVYVLKRDGTVYDATLTLDAATSAITLLVMQGSTTVLNRTMVNAQLATHMGRYTTWQLFKGSGGDTVPRLESVAADTPVDADATQYDPAGLGATLDLGSAGDGTGHLCGEVLWMVAGRGELSDTALAALNATVTDPIGTNIDQRSGPTSRWKADTTVVDLYRRKRIDRLNG